MKTSARMFHFEVVILKLTVEVMSDVLYSAKRLACQRKRQQGGM